MKAPARCGIIVLLLALSSCNSMHIPSMQNVPMFAEKGELKANLSARDVQLSYAATRSIGFALSGFYRPGGKILPLQNDKRGNYKGINHGFDMAIGFYSAYSRSSLELLAGYGQGYSSFTYNEYDWQSNSSMGGSSHFRKYYLQPGLTFFARGETKIALTTRLDVVSLYDFNDVRGVKLNSNLTTFFAPALTVRKKVEYVSLLCQLQYSVPAADRIEFGYYDPFQAMLMFQVGLTIHLNEFFRKETVTSRL